MLEPQKTTQSLSNSPSDYIIFDETKYNYLTKENHHGWEVNFAIDTQNLSEDLKKNFGAVVRKCLLPLIGQIQVTAKFPMEITSSDSENFGRELRLFFEDTPNKNQLSPEKISLILLTIWKNLQKANIPLVTITRPASQNIPGPCNFPTPLSITCKEEYQKGSLYKKFEANNANHPLLKLKFTVNDLESNEINYDIQSVLPQTQKYIKTHVSNIQAKCQKIADEVNQQTTGQTENINTYLKALESYSEHIKTLKAIEKEFQINIQLPLVAISEAVGKEGKEYDRKDTQTQIQTFLGTKEKFHELFQKTTLEAPSEITAVLEKMSNSEHRKIMTDIYTDIKTQAMKNFTSQNKAAVSKATEGLINIIDQATALFKDPQTLSSLKLFKTCLERKNIKEILANEQTIFSLLKQLSLQDTSKLQADFSRCFVTSEKVKPRESVYNFQPSTNSLSKNLEINAEKYMGIHYPNCEKLIAKNPNKMQKLFDEAVVCASIEEKNEQLVLEMEQLTRKTETEAQMYVSRARNGITNTYQPRAEKGFFESHLGPLSYIFQRKKGQNRAKIYLNHIDSQHVETKIDVVQPPNIEIAGQPKSDITQQLIGSYALLADPNKSDTLKSDVGFAILEDIPDLTKVTNHKEFKQKVPKMAASLVKDYLFFHADDKTKKELPKLVSDLQTKANTKPIQKKTEAKPSEPHKEGKEFTPTARWR